MLLTTDASDAGVAPAAGSFRELSFNITGDYAAWEMTITGLGPDDTRTRRISMGAPSTAAATTLKMRKGNSYRLSLRWLNSDGHTDPYSWYCWQTKIDGRPSQRSYQGYSTTRLSGNEVVIGNGWIAENADGLLTSHVHMHDPDEDGYGGGNVAGGLTATLYVLGDPKVVPDYNRDGRIDDNDEAVYNAGGTPFRFWVNDDNDSGDINDSANDRPGSGAAFKSFVEAAQPAASKRVVMTQSLGNMVACEALRQGLSVGKYFMFNAAVPSEAIDGTLQDTDAATRAKYVPSDWAGYDPRSWASNWHKWFTADANNTRSQLGWVDRYAASLERAGEVYNYYSTGDEVFYETANPPWLLEGVLDSTANYAWQKQETSKGSRSLAGTAYGGWGFHTWRIAGFDYTYSSTEANAMVASGAVTNNPVFNRGYEPMLATNLPKR